MYKWMRGLAVLACLAGLTAISPSSTIAQGRDDAHKELIGKPAMEMKTGFTLNGPQTNMTDLKGKVVLLDFWAVWCGPCVATFPHLRDWHAKYNKKGLEIIGVTTYYKSLDFVDGKIKKAETPLNTAQEEAMLEKFVAHHKLKHRIIALQPEDQAALAKYYQVSGIPQVVLIDRDGTVRFIKVGAGEANAKAIEAQIKKLLG